MVICIWGTVFLELWKRKNAVLAYEWDVHNFEDVEPDRPAYFGKKFRLNIVQILALIYSILNIREIACIKQFLLLSHLNPLVSGTDSQTDPITKEEIPFYPFKFRFMKYTVSFITFLVMVCKKYHLYLHAYNI